jgi:glycosyltransferase involved in cell wall biosynthesis
MLFLLQTKSTVSLKIMQIKKSVSLIIPAYNDRISLLQLVEEALSVLRNLTDDYEIVVTDDGSSDGTAEALKKTFGTHSCVRIVIHPVNQGFCETIKELYFSARKDLVMSCPGDGQISPGEILKMIPALERYDLVIGKRTQRMDNVARYIQTKIYNFLLRTFFGIKIQDVNSVKLFDRKKIMEGIQLESTSAFIEAELCIKAIYRGYRVGETPIRHERRQHEGASGGKLHIILPTICDFIRLYPVLNRFKKALKAA